MRLHQVCGCRELGSAVRDRERFGDIQMQAKRAQHPQFFDRNRSFVIWNAVFLTKKQEIVTSNG